MTFEALSRWRTMDRDELLARADRYRDLATRTLDQQTKQGLLDLAERYEALARDDEGLDDDPLSDL
jgi:hypothetical protein